MLEYTIRQFSSLVRNRVKLMKVSPVLSVPNNIPRPLEPITQRDYEYSNNKPYILKPSEIKKLREACRLTKAALDYAGEVIKEGMTTDELDYLVHKKILSFGAFPTCLGYSGYPKSIATSVNDIVCHGIPDSRPLEKGDIVNVDLVVYKDGFNGDSSRMFIIGETDKEGKRLVETTKQIMLSTIKQCFPGVNYSILGCYIENEAMKNGYTSVPDYCSHGVGKFMHMYPAIYHVRNNQPGVIKQNTAFTIEPMICEGSPDVVVDKDGWTVRTVDGKRSAQWEHTILVTENGPEILT